MEKYEYKMFEYNTQFSWASVSVNTDELQNQLNILGNEGWELVSSTPITVNNGRTKSIVCTLKRKKA